ncbi:MAG: DUF3576 domain-containing protein [Alphaproteobacteria bacterium]|nr:DUF3576 domain-containing protein [Alphaproteobacteria bacterium]
MSIRGRTILTVAIAATAAATLAGCASNKGGAQEASSGVSRTGVDDRNGGIRLFGGGDKKAAKDQAGIGVNAFLWRATLDVLSFMPLSSADPYGGVVTTDWYANPDKPNERFKATVYILDSRLRADGIKVAIFKEQLTANGWSTAPTDPDTAIQIENAILTKARQFKLATVGG